jgi:hypothetical protein
MASLQACEQYAASCPFIEPGDTLFDGVFASLKEVALM